MDPRTQDPSPDAPATDEPAADAASGDAGKEAVPPAGDAQARRKRDEHLDQELDEELDDTFPASDPIPWSHEVK
jgi:hypothetical protein